MPRNVSRGAQDLLRQIVATNGIKEEKEELAKVPKITLKVVPKTKSPKIPEDIYMGSERARGHRRQMMAALKALILLC